MEVICLEDKAFYTLLDKVVSRFTEQQERKQTDKWVSGEEAMKMLRITAKSTLQKFRDEGKIRFSQPEKKIILYDTDSIHEFLNKNARETF
ncbi:MAG: helix-turn-helix domain-containing protein [Chitinophagaceae bacterium]|nr:helix-turn-helix domain-containing protein [Chitinophagaceae bacterium]